MVPPALGALLLMAAAPVAAASPTPSTDLFIGKAVIPAGQSSPVLPDPRDISMRADGAIGIGYHYAATGEAAGQVPGAFHYDEHGYLYFKNPADPTTMVGSRFVSGVFTLTRATGGVPIQIAGTSPASYISGIRPLGFSSKASYGYFTFTDPFGTFTGYATTDFTRFVIEITFGV